MRHQCNAKNVSLRPGTSQAPRCYNLYAYREVIRTGAESLLLTARGTVGEWLSLVEHLVRDQGVGGSNPLSPTNSKALIGTHSGRNWAQLRESEAQSYPLCRHCTKHPVYLYPGTSVAL